MYAFEKRFLLRSKISYDHEKLPYGDGSSERTKSFCLSKSIHSFVILPFAAYNLRPNARKIGYR